MLEQKFGYHGDGDDLVGLIDDFGDLLVLHADHVLAVHLFAMQCNGMRKKTIMRCARMATRQKNLISGFVAQKANT